VLWPRGKNAVLANWLVQVRLNCSPIAETMAKRLIDESTPKAPYFGRGAK